MKLTDTQMSHVLRPGVLSLAEMFRKHNYELRVAGGAVRDLLRGIVPQDLDFATTATPQQMKEMFEKEEVRMINALGEKHGTITARIGEENFECTTLRIDVVTDGRHAEVQFTTDWYLDANRRDLTINSMFLGLDGTVYDYFDGISHLKEQKVEFVGEAEKRIQEDYLRILRYFRFYGRMASHPNSHNQAILDAITKNAAGLSKISGERIWSEMQKFVVGNFGGHLLKTLTECKICPYVGLPEHFSGMKCVELWEQCSACGLDPKTLHPMTVIAAGFKEEDEAYDFILRVKCSKKDREILIFILQKKDEITSTTDVKDVQDMFVDLVLAFKMPEVIARAQVAELLKYKCKKELLEEFRDWRLPHFPVKGGMLVGKLKNRKNTKVLLTAVLEKWKQSNFSLPADELLTYADEVVTRDSM